MASRVFDLFCLVLSALLFLMASSLASGYSTTNCRCFPGDSCWPDASTWQGLNTTVKGRLIKTIPIGTPCHDPTYNATQCAALQEAWVIPSTHFETSSSMQSPFIANRSCDPFTPESSPCLFGNYVSYAIDANEASDVVAAIAFVKKYNIRLVVRNTAHDYLGKSTGAGALAIWTHHLKDVSFLNYSSPHYAGKAMKIGAGVQSSDPADAVAEEGLIVLNGGCFTVGLVGSFTGGGHSPLSSKFGLGADEALEWEVIDGSGRFLTASRTQNKDLYWALSGGGGSSYGVIWSLTVKAHPEMASSGAYTNFTSAETRGGQDYYFAAILAFHQALPPMVDVGIVFEYFFTNETFQVAISAPGVPQLALIELMEPVADALDRLGFDFYFYQTYQFPTYLSMYNAIWGPGQAVFGAAEVVQVGSHLIRRSTMEQNITSVIAAWRNLTNDGLTIGGTVLNVNMTVAGDVDNAVLPAWRDTLVHSELLSLWDNSAPLSEMIANQQKMTDQWVPQLKKVETQPGAYLNEADWQEPDWKNAFYGTNYGRLLSVKARYDPQNIFYATTAVGSDEWVAYPEGRLCKA